MSTTSIKLKQLFAKQSEVMGKEVTVRGWIRNHRKQKNMGFIELYDGSCFKPLQLVYTTETVITPIIPAIVGNARLNLCACNFDITGKLSPSNVVFFCFFQNLYLTIMRQ